MHLPLPESPIKRLHQVSAGGGFLAGFAAASHLRLVRFLFRSMVLEEYCGVIGGQSEEASDIREIDGYIRCITHICKGGSSEVAEK